MRAGVRGGGIRIHPYNVLYKEAGTRKDFAL